MNCKIILPLCLTFTLLTGCTDGNIYEQRLSLFAFDTYLSAIFSGGDSHTLAQCKEAVGEEVTRLDFALDPYNKESPLYQLNSGKPTENGDISHMIDLYNQFNLQFGEGVTPACGELVKMWNIGDADNENPTIPNSDDLVAFTEKSKNGKLNFIDFQGKVEDYQLDFGGGAKGYACDRINEIYSQYDLDELIISTGSSLVLRSEDVHREFTVDIINPFDEGYVCQILTGNSFISTSGGYERFFEIDGVKYSHILDIKTGYPAVTDIGSVTVILPISEDFGTYSDLLSTLVYIGGMAKLEEYVQMCYDVFGDDFKIITVDENRNIYIYGGLDVSVKSVLESFTILK